jgi:hypothetical protein
MYQNLKSRLEARWIESLAKGRSGHGIITPSFPTPFFFSLGITSLPIPFFFLFFCARSRHAAPIASRYAIEHRPFLRRGRNPIQRNLYDADISSFFPTTSVSSQHGDGVSTWFFSWHPGYFEDCRAAIGGSVTR